MSTSEHSLYCYQNNGPLWNFCELYIYILWKAVILVNNLMKNCTMYTTCSVLSFGGDRSLDCSPKWQSFMKFLRIIRRNFIQDCHFGEQSNENCLQNHLVITFDQRATIKCKERCSIVFSYHFDGHIIPIIGCPNVFLRKLSTTFCGYSISLRESPRILVGCSFRSKISLVAWTLLRPKV